MRILAFDSALGACSVAMWEDGATLASASETMMRGQAERLVPMIRDVLEASGVAPDLLAVTVGPGAFTGIRIGLAAARGFALARDLPVLGVTTTVGLAASVPDFNGPLLVAFDSKRDELFVEYFAEGFTVSKSALGPVAVLPQNLADHLRACGYEAGSSLRVMGDAVDVVSVALSRDNVGDGFPLDIRAEDPKTPKPSAIAAVAAFEFARKGAPEHAPGPLYIKQPDVSAPEMDRARRPSRP